MAVPAVGARLVRHHLGAREPVAGVLALRHPDLSTSVTAGYLTGGVALTVLLHRSGHRQICHVLRSPAGFVLWVVFTLHLWSRRLDPFHAFTRLVRVAPAPNRASRVERGRGLLP